MTDNPYPHLFSPIELAGRRLRNRVCLPATVTNYARLNQITERWKHFLIERARGGAAMLVTEVIAVDPNAIAQPAIVTGFDDANMADLADTAKRVHAEGAWLIGQLWHPGKQQLWGPTRSPMGVSDQPDALSWTVPHVMSADEISAVAQAYIDTAARLAECGFAGVELHGAHGYLIQQFMSPWSNWRDDRYGGSMEKRLTFTREIAAGIRERCGDGFILGIKMAGTEGVEGGIEPDEAGRITAILAGDRIFDYFSYGQGNFSPSLEMHVPDMYFRPGHFIDIHKAMREAADGVPVMALGRIGEPDLAEMVVAEGYGDLVGMTRAQITDAAFALKATEGRAEEIRPCVFDNFSWGEVYQGKPVAEYHNPHLGEEGEADWKPAPADKPGRIVVVGAGVGGLEAAWIAAARGHAVTVFGANDEVGGGLRLEAQLPGRGDVAKVFDHQRRMAERHGVVFRLGETATAADIRALSPDSVVLATGAEPRWPETLKVEPGDEARVISARSAVAHELPAHAGRSLAVLFDQDHGPFTYGVADKLAEMFERVVLITPRPNIAQRVNHCSAVGVYRRLYAAGVEILPAMEPVSLTAGRLICRNVYAGHDRVFEAVDLLVYATPRSARDVLSAELDGLQVHRVGDCQSPRDLLAAIHGGHAIGNLV
ncbi:MAG: FAD-dependent oxidoreductase [Rhodospirillaceae bacterium]|nr:FAD-dependent oxidoreductase [Rhodospirillaceae bacterium]